MRATCGHEVENGITMEIHSFTREGDPCISYGTYCAECFFDYYKEDMVANREFHEFVKKLHEKSEAQ